MEEQAKFGDAETLDGNRAEASEIESALVQVARLRAKVLPELTVEQAVRLGGRIACVLMRLE